MATTATAAAAAPKKMPVWVWEGKTKAGEMRRGEIEAADEQQVLQRLGAMQLWSTKVKKKPMEIRLGSFLPGIGGVSQKALVIFPRQFATMIDAGLPLVQ